METVFTNCGVDVIDIPTPDGSQLKALVYIDKATGWQYTFPMDEELAKHVGGRLMGLGKVEVAAASALHNIRGQQQRNGGGQG